MVSVVIPVYNEEKAISDCLFSLSKQSYRPFEIIVVNDGSKDNSELVIRRVKSQLKIKNLKIFTQPHQGPGNDRNLGAKYAKGEILVFVDADMVFEKNFLRDLVRPIEEGKTIGTFSKEEYLLNKKNIWAICWNINRYYMNNWRLDSQVYERILPTYYPSHQPVFRAILKAEFQKVCGFADIGYTDDWTLSRKLKKEAVAVEGAVYYHRNPETVKEIFSQARWIGKNEFLAGNILRKLISLVRFSTPFSFIVGIIISVRMRIPHYLFFKIIYDLGIWVSVLLSFKEIFERQKVKKIFK